ncbi:MAG: hypothetical protein GOV00_00115, partial [Candidatus Altiarchaeota archaeon]|nr:hypothetical protein [Candidatus Altiarchaeota archaeon]
MGEPPLQLNSNVEAEGELPTAAIPLKSGLIPIGFLLLISGIFFVNKKVKFDEMKELRMSFTQDLIKVKNDAVVVNDFVGGGNENGKEK